MFGNIVHSTAVDKKVALSFLQRRGTIVGDTDTRTTEFGQYHVTFRADCLSNLRVASNRYFSNGACTSLQTVQTYQLAFIMSLLSKS